MKLEIGQRYIRRDGLLTSPLEKCTLSSDLWDDEHSKSYDPKYGGLYYIQDIESEHDLMNVVKVHETGETSPTDFQPET